MLHLVFLPFIIGTAWGHLDADREDLVEREALRTEEKERRPGRKGLRTWLWR